MRWKSVWTLFFMLRVHCACRLGQKPPLSWPKNQFRVRKSRIWGSDDIWRDQLALSRPRWSGVLDKPTRAIDSEHKEKGPCQFSAYMKHFQGRKSRIFSIFKKKIYIIVGSKVVQISREMGSIAWTASNPPNFFLHFYRKLFFLISSRLTQIRGWF